MSKNSKRIISIVISALMLISLLSVFCVPTFAEPEAVSFAENFPDTEIDGSDDGTGQPVKLTKDAVLMVDPAKGAQYEKTDASNGDLHEKIEVTINGTLYYFEYGVNAFIGDGTAYNGLASTDQLIKKMYKGGGTPQVVIAEWSNTTTALQIKTPVNLFGPNFNTKPYTNKGGVWQENTAYNENSVTIGFVAANDKTTTGNFGLYGLTIDGYVAANSVSGAGLNVSVQNCVINQDKFPTIKGIYINASKDHIYNLFNIGGGKKAPGGTLQSTAANNDKLIVKDTYIKKVIVPWKDDAYKPENAYEDETIRLIGNYVYDNVTFDGLWIPEEVGKHMSASTATLKNNSPEFHFTVKNSNIGGFLPQADGHNGMFYFDSTADEVAPEFTDRTVEFSNNVFTNVYGNSDKDVFAFADASVFTGITIKDNTFTFGEAAADMIDFGAATENSQVTDVTVTGNVINGLGGKWSSNEQLPNGTFTFDKNYVCEAIPEVTSGRIEDGIFPEFSGETAINNGYRAYDYTEKEFSQYSAELKEVKVGEVAALPLLGEENTYTIDISENADETAREITAAPYDTREGHVTVQIDGQDSATVAGDICKYGENGKSNTITLTNKCEYEGNTKTYTLKVTKAHSWGEPVIEQPDCTKPGTRSQTCTACGESNPAVDNPTVPQKDAHNWSNWEDAGDGTHEKRKCQNEPCEQTEQRLKGENIAITPSLTLYDNLNVNFKVTKSQLTGYENEGDIKLKVTMNGETQEIEAKEGTTNLLSGDANEPAWVFTFEGIAPDKFGDEITAKLYAGEKELTGKTYSVKEYCKNMLENPQVTENEALYKVLVDLLNYGAAAQEYKDYKPDALVNGDLTGEQKQHGTQQDVTPVDALNIENKDDASHTVPWLGAGLSLGSTIALRFTVRVEEEGITDPNSELSVAINGLNGCTHEFVKNESSSDNRYYLYIRGIAANQMSKEFTVVISKDGSPVSGKLTYTVDSYAAEVAKDGKADKELKDFTQAMVNYGHSVAEYHPAN